MKKKDNLPTAAENLRFFLTYQVNFMYWRYFLWNFVGRQNNIQGHGEAEHGNWITGFSLIDDWLLGCDTSLMPSDLSQNKGRNVFYAMPLLLGLLGIVWQWRKGRSGRQQLFVVMLLFVMTGLAIVVYLNQTPMQPRERDYAYAGSFYAFAVWIGLGVAAVWETLKRLLLKNQNTQSTQNNQNTQNNPSTPIILATLVALITLIVPLQMVSQTWDDHDRSGRYTCRDFGANYLNSTTEGNHPIILTNGDNDTFPLWYNHEVEGVRTDTRVCNMEYLNTDWYIDQMKRPAYDSPPLPISWQHDDYREGRMDYLPVETDSLSITHDGKTMTIPLKEKRYLLKNELAVLEMLSSGDWNRPVYLSISMGSELLSFLSGHLVLEGLAYRVSPTAVGQQVDVERLYDNVMHRFRFGELNAEGIYVDEDVKHLANTHQYVMSILIDSLLARGDADRALAVCRKWQQEMPAANVPYTEAALSMARCYYVAGQTEQGDAITENLLRRADEWLRWIATISPNRRAASHYSQYVWLKAMRHALSVAAEQERTELFHQYRHPYENHLNNYQDS